MISSVKKFLHFNKRLISYSSSNLNKIPKKE